MIISADPKNPHFSPAARRAEVFLNGEPLNDCVTADSDAGTAICLKVDEIGRVMIRDDEFVTEIRRGNVCIVLPSDE